MSTDQPPLCYVIVPGAAPGKRIGIVKRGEKGYYKAGVDNGRMPARALVDHLNEKLERKARRQRRGGRSMRIGSIFGWDVPGAKVPS